MSQDRSIDGHGKKSDAQKNTRWNFYQNRNLTTKHGGMDFKFLKKKLRELKNEQKGKALKQTVTTDHKDGTATAPSSGVSTPTAALTPGEGKTKDAQSPTSTTSTNSTPRQERSSGIENDSIIVDEGCLVDIFDMQNPDDPPSLTAQASSVMSAKPEGALKAHAISPDAKSSEPKAASPIPSASSSGHSSGHSSGTSSGTSSSTGHDVHKSTSDGAKHAPKVTVSHGRHKSAPVLVRGQPRFNIRLPIFQRGAPVASATPEIPRDDTFEAKAAMEFRNRMPLDEPAKCCLRKTPSPSTGSPPLTIDDRYVEQVHMSPSNKPRRFKKPKGDARNQLYRLADKARLYEDKYKCALPEQYYDYTPPELVEELDRMEQQRQHSKKLSREARSHYKEAP